MDEIYVDTESVIAGADPCFHAPGKVHDWRNHVGPAVEAIWNTFTADQKRAIIADAEEAADREVWD